MEKSAKNKWLPQSLDAWHFWPEGTGKHWKYALNYSLFFSMHISESQQEFFRMLDEKIEKVRSEVTAYFKGTVASWIKSNNILVSVVQSCSCKGVVRINSSHPTHTTWKVAVRRVNVWLSFPGSWATADLSLKRGNSEWDWWEPLPIKCCYHCVLSTPDPLLRSQAAGKEVLSACLLHAQGFSDFFTDVTNMLQSIPAWGSWPWDK